MKDCDTSESTKFDNERAKPEVVIQDALSLPSEERIRDKAVSGPLKAALLRKACESIL